VSREDFDTVPNGIRLPPIAMATKSASSANAEPVKKERSHQKDRYDVMFIFLWTTFPFVFKNNL